MYVCERGSRVSWLGNVALYTNRTLHPSPFRANLHSWISIIGTKEEGDREITSSRESPPVRAKKPRKARTAFSDHQLNQLERSFERQKYLSVQDRMDLAAALNLTDTQVKTWYQNRR